MTLFAKMCVLLGGCATVTVDHDGTRHVSGFMMLTLQPPNQDVGADVIRMRTVGVTVTNGTTLGSQVTLGYSDTTIAALRNNAAVSGVALNRAVDNAQAKEK
jgi:hypothetical protein